MSRRKAWVFQRGDSWYVGWYTSDGSKRRKSFGKQTGAKSAAKKYAAQKTSDLVSGIGGESRIGWSEFVAEFLASEKGKIATSSLDEYARALSNFGRIADPKSVADITSRTIDKFASERLDEPTARNKSRTCSPSTVNKELRSVKRALRKAKKWDYLREVPDIELLKIEKTLPTFVTEAEFAAIYKAAGTASKPSGDPGHWWQTLMVYLWMTGWRISETMKLLWEDVDLQDGFATTRASDNKARRKERVPLHPVIIEHLEKMPRDRLEVFWFDQHERQLWVEFQKIQEHAGVEKRCKKSHQCTDACKWFGFHDLRRSFATHNAANLSAVELQTLMRHASFETTKLYVSMARQSRDAVVNKLKTPTLQLEES